MKKVININFQGRIIPIEETAYELLKQYIESLRSYFATEEGRDEIINDIESRIAELFSARLDAGAHCIVDEDVLAVISTIGRPEDFDNENGTNEGQKAKSTNTAYSKTETGPGKFYRNADDKILGGVCSGLANYMKTDPVLIRIITVFLVGAVFWLYILLWLILPSRSLQTSITRRFYRKPEGKVFGGVCGGLAVYFNTEVWIPRLIFALPAISALVSGTWDTFFGDWDFAGWHLITGSLGSSLLVVYLILWIAVPMAKSASDLLEMKGEKIDLESIRNTVKDNLGQIQARAENFGSEVRESAGKLAKRNESGLLQFLRFIVKAIVFFVAGCVALGLLAVFIGLAFGGMAVFPLKNLLLEGTAQNTLAWCTLVLVIGVPVIAIITWLIRRISGIRSGKSYLSTAFGLLWVAGIVCGCFLFASVHHNLRIKHSEVVQVNMLQPPGDTLIITAQQPGNLEKYARRFWNDIDEDDEWLAGIYRDSFQLKNIKVHVDQSPDSLYHIYEVKYSRGSSQAEAKEFVSRIRFNIQQDGNRIILPSGIMLSKKDKFRNQQVMVVIEVPAGRKISFDKSLNNYSWITFRNNSRNFSINYQDDEHDYNSLYTMTPAGLRNNNHAEEATDNNGTGERQPGYFSAVELNLPIKVTLHDADRNYIVVHAPAADAAHIRTRVHNNVLSIDQDDNSRNISGDISIDVYSTRYEAVELNGSGHIGTAGSLVFDEELEIGLNGSGNIELLGSCTKASVSLSGSGNINLQGVSTSMADVELSGSGEILLHAKDNIKGELNGSGHIINAGKAISTNIEVNGSGKFLER